MIQGKRSPGRRALSEKGSVKTYVVLPAEVRLAVDIAAAKAGRGVSAYLRGVIAGFVGVPFCEPPIKGIKK